MAIAELTLSFHRLKTRKDKNYAVTLNYICNNIKLLFQPHFLFFGLYYTVYNCPHCAKLLHEHYFFQKYVHQVRSEFYFKRSISVQFLGF